jgi:hypothetical protein
MPSLSRWQRAGALAVAGGLAVVAVRRLLRAQSRDQSRQNRRVWRASPELTEHLAAQSPNPDFIDAWAVEVFPEDPASPADWAHAVFGLAGMPSAVRGLLALRDALVKPFGIGVMDGPAQPFTGFPLLDQGDDEVVLGADDRHLSFRVGLRVQPTEAVVTTTVTVLNWFGHLYWPVVRRFHPLVVKMILRRLRHRPPALDGAPGPI